MSFSFIEYIGLENEGMWPCWVEAYRFSEYAAARNLIIIIRGAVIEDFLKIAVNKMISLSKLIDGGAAIFHAEKINHHIVIIGRAVIIPLVKNILRVWVTSYVRLAKIKSADEQSPWAIMIINPPHIAQFEFVKILANISPMCPTDEYAINDLMSDCRRQIKLVIIAPHSDNLIKILDIM